MEAGWAVPGPQSQPGPGSHSKANYCLLVTYLSPHSCLPAPGAQGLQSEWLCHPSWVMLNGGGNMGRLGAHGPSPLPWPGIPTKKAHALNSRPVAILRVGLGSAGWPSPVLVIPHPQVFLNGSQSQVYHSQQVGPPGSAISPDLLVDSSGSHLYVLTAQQVREGYARALGT